MSSRQPHPTGVTTLVTADVEAALARRTLDALRAARVEVRVVGVEDVPQRGVHVLLDDPSLPMALTRLIHTVSGREILPAVVLVVADAARGGLLLADGFRDVVGPSDAGQAVLNISAARAPVVLERLKRELEDKFLPGIVGELARRAAEIDRLLHELVLLLKAIDVLAARRTRMEKLAHRQAVDEAIVSIGDVETFSHQLATSRRPRPYAIKRFKVSRVARNALSTGEPRLGRGKRDIVADTIAWLDNADLIAVVGAEARAGLDRVAQAGRRSPVGAFRECIEILEGERRMRLDAMQELQQELEPRQATASWLLEQHGLEVLPPGHALPEHVARLVRSHVHPPPEVYETWCIDLRAMRLVMLSEVLADIAKAIAASSPTERRAPNPIFITSPLKEH